MGERVNIVFPAVSREPRAILYRSVIVQEHKNQEIRSSVAVKWCEELSKEVIQRYEPRFEPKYVYCIPVI